MKKEVKKINYKYNIVKIILVFLLFICDGIFIFISIKYNDIKRKNEDIRNEITNINNDITSKDNDYDNFSSELENKKNELKDKIEEYNIWLEMKEKVK